MRERLRAILSTKAWESAITALIIANAVTLGLETSGAVVARFGPALLALDFAILAVFTVEIAARLYVHRWRFFGDAWNVFDFVVVAVALVPSSGPFQVLRALRILRVLRLISVVPSLRRVVSGLVAALPGMGSIVFLLGIVFYVGAVMATELFGERFPEWFGSLGLSAYTLFQIMTLESWSMGIVRPVMETFPYAWVFFVPFILMTSFVVLNLFIGVVVSAMQEQVEESAAENRAELAREGESLGRAIKAMRKDIAELRAVVEKRL
ncbi:ion transporter [Acuticoccus sp. I52.16.1]|uniref:ion transporter n=1 Tax=Acuticoccus sp. I52.16.1 TaxID=2928472 RepID=UPI001FD40DEC|nr:ion transporter [Acuticoccus sp. I52.16.1]UOM36054.1 ion transporter [Acuticoccus sp. I52.16.1]